MLASDDHVVVHSTYDGLFGPGIKTVGFDLGTVSGGKIVEHWDVLQTDPNSRGKTFDTLGNNGAEHTMFR